MVFKFEDRYRRDMPQTTGETDSVFDRANYCEWLEKSLDEAEQRVADCEGLLKDIGDWSHDRSTGPAVIDDLWEVRRMAYEL